LPSDSSTKKVKLSSGEFGVLAAERFFNLRNGPSVVFASTSMPSPAFHLWYTMAVAHAFR